jgi:hypothetical protein
MGHLTWKQVPNKAQEQWHIIVHKLGQVGVPECPHQHKRLWHVWCASLEGPCHDQDTLECAQPKVVVVLLGQLVTRQIVEDGHFLGKHLAAASN